MSAPSPSLSMAAGPSPLPKGEPVVQVNRPVSKLIALLPAGHAILTFGDLDVNLGRSDLDLMFHARRGALRCELLQGAFARMPLDVRVRPTAAIPALRLRLMHLREPDIDAALASRICLTVTCKLAENALAAIHAELRLLAALAPDAVAMLDLNACTAKSGDWMRGAASAELPPPATSFFTIHSVFDWEGGGETWLHTHGLRRMGSIELDMLGVRAGQASAMASVINHVARDFVENGVPPPHTPSRTANGSLMWVPCDSVSAPSALYERDAEHRQQRGVLLAAPGPLVH